MRDREKDRGGQGFDNNSRSQKTILYIYDSRKYEKLGTRKDFCMYIKNPKTIESL